MKMLLAILGHSIVTTLTALGLYQLINPPLDWKDVKNWILIVFCWILLFFILGLTSAVLLWKQKPKNNNDMEYFFDE